MILTHTVDPSLSGASLRHVLRQMGIGVQQTALILKTDSVRVDGEFVYPNQPVFEGEILEISLPGFPPRDVVPVGTLPTPKVLYEDDAYLAVFKPSGVQTHPSKTARIGKEDSMEERVMSSLQCVAHPFHRLDAETQGILLFAKFPYAQVALQEQLFKGGFRKQYEAYIFGTLPADTGIIEAPIERKHSGSYTRIIREDGRPSTTTYAVLDIQSVEGHPVSHVLLSPMTGRTHQLRVHMYYLHCPILGDPRYCTLPSTAFQETHMISDLQLNAFKLEFHHPFLNQKITISSNRLANPFWYSKSDSDISNQPQCEHTGSSRFLW